MTGFEPLIGAAAAGLGGLITNLVKDKGTETLKRIDWDIGKNLAVKKALVGYVRRYIDRHGTLKVACVRMDYPVRLDEIYTAVQLLDRSALRYFESEDALQTQYRESGKRGFNVTQAAKKPGLQVANEQQYLMVLGGPGVGKSTFLRKVGLEALRTLGRRDFAGKDPGNLLVPQQIFYQHPCIPVMLELRQFDKPDLSIQAVIAAELKTCGFPHPEELTELFLKNGKLLVLLDGLDEVPNATLNHVITEIENLVDRHSDNRYIASCRVAAYTFGGFRRFKDVAMAAFEDEQIEQFIKNWFQKERDTETNTADRCWQLLNSPDYQAAKELAQTPLLLTLLCVVYDEFQDFPKKRHALYGEALDVLLRKWASEKRIQRNPIYQELSAELELDMLAEIAYTSFVDDQLFFSKDRLINQIREFLVNNLNAPDHLDAETVLREIEIQQGILVERARDTYSFSHLTFQEYLTAKCIVDNQKIDQMVRDHVTSQQWREVFLLAAGLAPGKSGANRLLLLIESHAKSYLTNRKIQELIRWTSAIARSECDVSSSVLQRALAILLIRSCDVIRDEDLALARDLSKILNLNQKEYLFSELDLALKVANSLVEALDKKLYYNLRFVIMNSLSSKNLSDTRLLMYVQTYLKFGILRKDKLENLLGDLLKIKSPTIEDNYSSQSVHDSYKEYLHELRLCVTRNLNIGFDIISLSYQESHFLVLYLSLLELIASCKEAAVRVSPHVWASIESRMVTVPN